MEALTQPRGAPDDTQPARQAGVTAVSRVLDPSGSRPIVADGEEARKADVKPFDIGSDPTGSSARRPLAPGETICRYCRETIREGATLCRYCRSALAAPEPAVRRGMATPREDARLRRPRLRTHSSSDPSRPRKHVG